MTASFKINQWTTKPLIEVATLQRGYDLPVQDRINGSHPIFAANGTVGFHASAKCKGPGVVTGRSGTIGRVHFVDSDYWPLNTSLYVNDFHGNDPKWVFYMLQSFGLEKYSQGAGVPTLNRNLIHGEPVRVPPISEQRRIAAILDQADALRAKRREALAELDGLAQAIFVEMFGDPISNSGQWPSNELIDLVDANRPITYGILMPGPDQDDGISYIRVTDIKNGIINASGVKKTTVEISEKYTRSKLKTGDLLISIRGHVGRMAITPLEFDGANITQDTARIAFASMNSTFAMEQISTPSFQRWLDRHTKGMAVKGINLADVKRMPLINPPLTMQNIFASKAKQIQTLKTIHQKSISELDALFASLQHRAFRGEL